MKKQMSFKEAPGSSQTTIGKLYLVGTPIGNLEDMTMRAIRILNEVDLIAAEDTRQTRKLLTHFDIHTRLVSYHEHNKQDSGKELIRLLLEGHSIALVSDAGMPAISDPGADLAAEAAEQEIAVIPVPGANAALAALIVSGLPTEQFQFVGFPPRGRKERAEWMEVLTNTKATLIMYESPHRIKKTCQALLECFGDRRVAFVRELTKRHEEVLRGTLQAGVAWFEEHDPIGEYCIVMEGNDGQADHLQSGDQLSWWEAMSLEEHVAHYERQMTRKEAIKQTAVDREMPKRDVYNEVNRS